jgi:hypothetical protein
MDMKNRIRNENVSGSRPVISRFYFHLRAGGFHPSSTIHINSPPNPNHLRLHLSLQYPEQQISKKKKASRRTELHASRSSRPPPRRCGRGLQSGPATASTTPPVAEQVAASSPDQRQRAQPRQPPSRSRPPVQTGDLWFPSTSSPRRPAGR